MCSSWPRKERLSAAVFAALLLLLIVPHALGEGQKGPFSELVVIELGHRPAELLIPLILPHIRAGEVTVSGSGRQVIVGGTPSQVAEVLALIDALDQPPRQLLITVAEGALGEDRNLVAAPCSATEAAKGTGDRSAYRTRRRDLADVESYHANAARGIHTRNRLESRYFQEIPLLEGEWASIYTGPSEAEGGYAAEFRAHPDLWIFPDVTDLDRKVWFSVRALLLGDQVTVDAAFLQDGVEGYDTARNEQRRTRTTVKGQLGQWLLISPPRSSATLTLPRQGETVHATVTRAKGALPVWLRVDEMDP